LKRILSEESIRSKVRSGYHRNFKIGGGENISDCPAKPLFCPMAERSQFSHQQIGKKKKDDETASILRSPLSTYFSSWQVMIPPRQSVAPVGDIMAGRADQTRVHVAR
jgi:hypothetical protein